MWNRGPSPTPPPVPPTGDCPNYLAHAPLPRSPELKKKETTACWIAPRGAADCKRTGEGRRKKKGRSGTGKGLSVRSTQAVCTTCGNGRRVWTRRQDRGLREVGASGEYPQGAPTSSVHLKLLPLFSQQRPVPEPFQLSLCSCPE